MNRKENFWNANTVFEESALASVENKSPWCTCLPWITIIWVNLPARMRLVSPLGITLQTSCYTVNSEMNETHFPCIAT
jgi:hypothetical protein